MRTEKVETILLLERKISFYKYKLYGLSSKPIIILIIEINTS
jgi:hypothetical protein